MLKTFSNDLLIERFVKLVRTERKITHLILECIAEIDRRELHLAMAYPSLFEYLTRVHGYSAGAAQRRISAARLLAEVPQLADKIEDGKLTLSQVALATQNIKLAEKKFAAPMSSDDKLELLEKIESRSFAETQTILARELKIEAPSQERVQHHADGSITITMTLTQEQHRDWCRASELASHSLPNRKWAEIAHYLAKREISRRTEIKRASSQRQTSSRNPRQIKPSFRKRLLAGENPLSKVPGEAELFDRQDPSGCAYTDPRTGRVCGSRHLAQIDHIHPVHRGGDADFRNLRVLCAFHNRFRYRKEI